MYVSRAALESKICNICMSWNNNFPLGISLFFSSRCNWSPLEGICLSVDLIENTYNVVILQIMLESTNIKVPRSFPPLVIVKSVLWGIDNGPGSRRQMRRNPVCIVILRNHIFFNKMIFETLRLAKYLAMHAVDKKCQWTLRNSFGYWMGFPESTGFWFVLVMLPPPGWLEKITFFSWVYHLSSCTLTMCPTSALLACS